MNKSHYELTYIIDGNIPETENAQISQKIKDIVTSKAAEITLFQEFGRKKLSYEIKKSSKGTYFVIEFEAEPSSLKDIEKDLKLEKSILRYLILGKPRNIGQVNPDNVKDQSEIKLDNEKRERPQSRQDNKRTHEHENRRDIKKETIETAEEDKAEIVTETEEKHEEQTEKVEIKQEEVKEIKEQTQQEEIKETDSKDDKDDLDKKLDELLNKDEF